MAEKSDIQRQVAVKGGFSYNIQSRKVFYNACFVAVLSGRMFMLCSSVSNMFMLCSSAREIRDYLSTSAFATIELE